MSIPWIIMSIYYILNISSGQDHIVRHTRARNTHTHGPRHSRRLDASTHYVRTDVRTHNTSTHVRGRAQTYTTWLLGLIISTCIQAYYIPRNTARVAVECASTTTQPDALSPTHTHISFCSGVKDFCKALLNREIGYDGTNFVDKTGKLNITEFAGVCVRYGSGIFRLDWPGV